MDLKSIDKLDNSRCRLRIEIDSKTFNSAIKEVYSKKSKRCNLPGFRRGKAPLSIIEKHYGEKVFFDDAIEYLYPKALQDAVLEAGVEIIDDKIDFKLISAEKDSGVVFESTLTIKPEVQIEGYKNLDIKEPSLKITKGDIDKEIEIVAEQNARLITAEDKAAELGDIVIMDFEGFVGKSPIEDSKAENFSLKLGSDYFIKGFESSIVGHKAGEEFEMKVTFPGDYPVEKLKSKHAIFKVKIHKVKIQEIPKIDDEFAKDVSEFETLKEYRESLKESLTKVREVENRSEVEKQIIKKLSKIVKVDVPEAVTKRYVKNISERFVSHLTSKNLDIETYLKYNNLTEEQMKDDFRKTAETRIRADFAVEKIAKLENIKVTDDDISKKRSELASIYGVDESRIDSLARSADFMADMLSDKVFKFLIDSSKKSKKATK